MKDDQMSLQEEEPSMAMTETESPNEEQFLEGYSDREMERYLSQNGCVVCDTLQHSMKDCPDVVLCEDYA
jgi:hypothetical protein